MFDLNDLYYFVESVDHGGFAPAGRAIGVPKSKLSRRIKNLEERLGVRLVQRSTRRFVLTDVGRRYYDHCRAMLVEAEAAQEVIDTLQAAPRGRLRVTCPIGLLGFHVADMLADFLSRYPEVSLQLEATNRRVDVLAEGVDIAIRVRPLPLEDSDLVVRVLSDRQQCIVASPGLVGALGTPQQPDDLAAFPSLSRDFTQSTHAWFLAKDEESVTVAHTPRYVTSDMMALRTAALAGVGIVQLPLLMLKRHEADGSLIQLLPGWRPRPEVIHVVFPSRRGMLPSVRALIDHLVDRYAVLEEE